MSKRVLMIANQFPPMGGSGVQRSAKFAKYLPKFGWESVVFTRECKGGLNDASLLKDIPDDLEIIRTKPYDLTQLKFPLNIPGKIVSRKFLIPDADVIWYKKNKEQLLDYVRKNKIDVIYSTSYPYSDHLLGLYIKKHLNDIPWVVDFRDEWCNNPYILDMGYSKFRIKLERKMEAEVVNNCDYFITNTPLMLKNFLKDYDIEDKSYVIPNGYDEEDFQELDHTYVKKEKFVITYSGSMYGRRKPDYFLEAVQSLINENKIDRDKLCIRFIGNFSNKQMTTISEKFNLKDVVSYLPYMEHKKSIEKLLESDALLFIIGAGKGAENFYSGKVFEYMNTNRPIIALVPEAGVAADVIKETKTGLIAETTDVPKIKEVVYSLYNNWKSDNNVFQPNWERIKDFERKELTRQLSAIFDQAYNRD